MYALKHPVRRFHLLDHGQQHGKTATLSGIADKTLGCAYCLGFSKRLFGQSAHARAATARRAPRKIMRDESGLSREQHHAAAIGACRSVARFGASLRAQGSA